MSTQENLSRAFTEEARNIERYLAFAEKAEADGEPQIARLFRAVAESERVHARVELRLLGEVRSTAENIESAVSAEEAEFQDMYGQFLREAKEEEQAEAAEAFGRILAVERTHYQQFRDALAKVRAGEDVPTEPVFVCGVCGNTVTGSAPETCPVCGAPQAEFTEVR